MSSPLLPDRILQLRLSGPYAHFRKFYTNASSLTYKIPPGTALRGLCASILQFPRDSYYDRLGTPKLQIAIAIEPGAQHKTILQTLNYASGIGVISPRKQCRLELLMNSQNQDLAWHVYLGFRDKSERYFETLEQKIRRKDFGYGVYLGQRQFIGSIELIQSYESEEFEYVPKSEYLDSAICRQQVLELESDSYNVLMERMPLEQTLIQEKKRQFRQTSRFGDVVYELSGMRIPGRFTNLIELKNQNQTRIAFL